jgi:nucleotide-binding universal stress UspA family protein
MTTTDAGTPAPIGPVLFAYDGTELAGLAIEHAAAQLAPGRDALVVCVWQPADVGFVPTTKRHFDADEATEVRSAAEETAAHGAELARAAGFRAESLVVETSPTWQGIVQTAEERQASLIVVGSHRHGGIMGHFHGNFAAAVVAHSTISVMVVHQRS